jgi:hypothetical protein
VKFSRLKYRKGHSQQDERRSRGRKSSAFFIKPYLATREVYKSRVDEITSTFMGKGPEKFRGNVWRVLLIQRSKEIIYEISYLFNSQ